MVNLRPEREEAGSGWPRAFEERGLHLAIWGGCSSAETCPATREAVAQQLCGAAGQKGGGLERGTAGDR